MKSFRDVMCMVFDASVETEDCRLTICNSIRSFLFVVDLCDDVSDVLHGSMTNGLTHLNFYKGRQKQYIFMKTVLPNNYSKFINHALVGTFIIVGGGRGDGKKPGILM